MELIGDLRQVCVFSNIKIDRHDITEILLKVVFKHHYPSPIVTQLGHIILIPSQPA
jgi:hypothetical protein